MYIRSVTYSLSTIKVYEKGLHYAIQTQCINSFEIKPTSSYKLLLCFIPAVVRQMGEHRNIPSQASRYLFAQCVGGGGGL